MLSTWYAPSANEKVLAAAEEAVAHEIGLLVVI